MAYSMKVIVFICFIIKVKLLKLKKKIINNNNINYYYYYLLLK